MTTVLCMVNKLSVCWC